MLAPAPVPGAAPLRRPLRRIGWRPRSYGARASSIVVWGFGLDGNQVDTTVRPVARTAASIVVCRGLVLREEEGLAGRPPRLASHPYVALHARHFKIQLEVVRVWARVGEIGDEKEGSETVSNCYHQLPALHASQVQSTAPPPVTDIFHNGQTLRKKIQEWPPA